MKVRTRTIQNVPILSITLFFNSWILILDFFLFRESLVWKLARHRNSVQEPKKRFTRLINKNLRSHKLGYVNETEQ